MKKCTRVKKCTQVNPNEEMPLIDGIPTSPEGAFYGSSGKGNVFSSPEGAQYGGG
jgi:hypothetical protein